MPSQHVLLPRDVYNAMVADWNSTATPEQRAAIKQFLINPPAIDESEDVTAKFVFAARTAYCDDETEIDMNPIISRSDEGAFVMGWLWVSNSDAGIPEDEERGHRGRSTGECAKCGGPCLYDSEGNLKEEKPRTSEELGNQHGYKCPKCDCGDELTISATVNVQARLSPAGTDDEGGDTTWEDDSPARCGCGWEGTVKDLVTVEIEESD